MPEKHANKLATIKLLALDFDGVFTSGHVIVDENDKRSYCFSIQDGMGLVLLLAMGVEVAVMTTSNNAAIRNRMARLGIKHLNMGALDKAAAVTAIAAELGIDLAEVAYLSDDINDLPALRIVGLPIAVANAREQVKASAAMQCQASGGDGAIREVCDALIAAQGGDPEALWIKACARL